MTLAPGYYVHLKPLVAVIGPPDLQAPLTTYLEQAFTPQLKTVACPDATAFAACLDYGGTPMSPTSRRSGIVRADWVAKHQSRRPAAALILVGSDQAAGDPSAWASLAASLDAIAAAAAAPRGVRTVVAVASGASGALPEDRAAMLARHSGAERGAVVAYDPNDGPEALKSVAAAVLAAATAHYSADASRRLATYSKGSLDSADANLRAAFKLGALTELRGDAAAAAALYREALGCVPQIALAGAAPLQRFLEVRDVAEACHSRLQGLLLGALGDTAGAAAQLATHMAALRAPPLAPCPPGLAANHAGWAARQLAAAAEAITAAGVAPESLPPTARPAHLLAEAAALAASRRRILEGSEESDLVRKFRAAAEGGSGIAAPGRYLGQLEINGNASPSDEEVEAWLHAEAAREAAEGGACLSMLRAAREAAATAAAPTARRRALCSIDAALGEELLAAGDVEGARAALTEAAEQLRADGWPGPLWRALLLLRKCAAKAGDRATHVALSLEAAALSGAADEGQRRAMAAAAAGELAQLPPVQATAGDTASPWTGVFKSSAGWSPPPSAVATDSATSPPTPTFTVAVLNAAPVDLPLNSAEITFEDADGEFSLPVATSPAALPAQRPTLLTVALSPAVLAHRPSHHWISASKATLHVGTTLTVARDLSSGGTASIPTATLALLPGPRVQWGQLKVDLPPRHEPPLLTLWTPNTALTREAVPFAVTVATGDCSLRGCKLVVGATAAEGAASVIQHGSGAPQPQVELDFPEVAPRGTHTVWLRLAPGTRPGDTVALAAQLEYAAVVDAAAESTETGTVSAAASVPVLTPFECDFAVLGPFDIKYVLPQPSVDAGLQTLSMGDGGSSPAAPRLPTSYLLPAGHRCTAAATVRSTSAVPVAIVDVQFAASEGLNVTPLGGAPLGELARAGDACSTGFLLESSASTVETAVPSLGTLTVCWRRAVPAPLAAHPSVEGTNDSTQAPSAPDSYANASDHAVQIPLPPAALLPPALMVRAAFPPSATVGGAVTLHLDIAAAEPGEVEIEVGEPSSFLVAGPRVTSVDTAAAPRLSLALVPYHVGMLPLPEVTVSKAGVGAVQATRGAVMAVGVVGAGAVPASEG